MIFKRTYLAVLSLAFLTLIAHGDESSVTGYSSRVMINGKTYGFCGMMLLEIHGQPAACFGVHQPPGGKPRYTYLILLKPDPKAKRHLGSGGGGASMIGSDGRVICDLKLSAYPSGREINLEYKLDADGEKITSETFKVDGKDYGKDGPRVFLVDLGAEKLAFLPIKINPQAVPDFADEETWGKQILAAKQELIEKSKEVKAFFGEDDKILPDGESPQFFVVSAVAKEGLVLQRRYPPTKEVDAPEVIEYKPTFKQLKARDVKGAVLSSEQLLKRLKVGQVVLVNVDDDALIDKRFVEVIRDDTVILSGVLPQKGATGLKAGN